MTLNKEIRLACVSDIHLGHKRVSTEEIIDRFNSIINNRSFLLSIDLLVIVGDLFDSLLNYASVESRLSDKLIASLLRNCAKYNVFLLVVEGTPSHDRKQSIRFRDLNNEHQKAGLPSAQLLYIDELDIVYLERFEINVLIVPDEWSPTPEDTLDQVRTLLIKKEIEQVDFAFMHGMFEYQAAEMAHIPAHNSLAYHGLVKHLIFIGHIHTFTKNDRIIAQGSFDRLAHGEEEPKGLVRAIVNINGEYTVDFIENKKAHTFITIRCYLDEVSDNLIEIDRLVKDLRPGSYVRIWANKNNPILSNIGVIKERWSSFIWSQIVHDKNETKKEIILDHKAVYTPLLIDRRSISQILFDRLVQRNYPVKVIEQCGINLKEIIEL